jgi:putative phosphoesterase
MLSVCAQSLELKSGKIGLISDTHGLVRPEALGALRGSELLIHAGDIGKPEVLDSLRKIAPVLAIRGNNDRDAWAKGIPDVLNLLVNGIKLQVIHNVHEFAADPSACGIDAVISGHSHKPGVSKRDEVLYVNPGSAGPRRFKLPIAVGMIYLTGKKLRATIIELQI